MGIKKLMSLIAEKAQNSIRRCDLEMFSGRIMACDASIEIELTDKEGNKTGHLIGLFNRTLQLIEMGIKPVWVFDGDPPAMKSGELNRRKKKKETAKLKTEAAKEEGNIGEELKNNQMNVLITPQMKEDAKHMLQLLGVPVVQAPCEAEAQCALLCKAGKVYATVTEDMDALTFGTCILIRNMNAKKEPVWEINFDEMLKGLGMDYAEFVDLCILCGCDYTGTIDGIGPVKAFSLIKECHTIENVLEFLKNENLSEQRKRKYGIPQNMDEFRFEDSRKMFFNPLVIPPDQIKFTFKKADQEKVRQFLVEQKGFSEARVLSGLNRIKKKQMNGYQPRLESFFGKAIIKSQPQVIVPPVKKVIQRKPKIKKTDIS